MDSHHTRRPPPGGSVPAPCAAARRDPADPRALLETGPGRLPRDRVTALFATALDGDRAAEATLRWLALDDEPRAVEALTAIVGTAAADIHNHGVPADVRAANDQAAAAIRDALADRPGPIEPGQLRLP